MSFFSFFRKKKTCDFEFVERTEPERTSESVPESDTSSLFLIELGAEPVKEPAVKQEPVDVFEEAFREVAEKKNNGVVVLENSSESSEEEIDSSNESSTEKEVISF